MSISKTVFNALFVGGFVMSLHAADPAEQSGICQEALLNLSTQLDGSVATVAKKPYGSANKLDTQSFNEALEAEKAVIKELGELLEQSDIEAVLADEGLSALLSDALIKFNEAHSVVTESGKALIAVSKKVSEAHEGVAKRYRREGKRGKRYRDRERKATAAFEFASSVYKILTDETRGDAYQAAHGLACLLTEDSFKGLVAELENASAGDVNVLVISDKAIDADTLSQIELITEDAKVTVIQSFFNVGGLSAESNESVNTVVLGDLFSIGGSDAADEQRQALKVALNTYLNDQDGKLIVLVGDEHPTFVNGFFAGVHGTEENLQLVKLESVLPVAEEEQEVVAAPAGLEELPADAVMVIHSKRKVTHEVDGVAVTEEHTVTKKHVDGEWTTEERHEVNGEPVEAPKAEETVTEETTPVAEEESTEEETVTEEATPVAEEEVTEESSEEAIELERSELSADELTRVLTADDKGKEEA